MLPLRLESALLQGSRLGLGWGWLGSGWLARLGSGWLFLGLGLEFGWLSAGFWMDFGFGLILA